MEKTALWKKSMGKPALQVKIFHCLTPQKIGIQEPHFLTVVNIQQPWNMNAINIEKTHISFTKSVTSKMTDKRMHISKITIFVAKFSSKNIH